VGGQRLGNCGGVGGGDGTDCPSVPSGFAASVESGIGGFSRGSSTIRGCGGLRDAFCIFFGARLGLSCSGFSGGIVGVVSGKSSGPLGSFSDSIQCKKVCLNSSIAAHPARPKVAHRAIRTSATRAQARIGGPSALQGRTMSGGFGGGSFGDGGNALGVEG
jgi:hypothetical protein